MDKEQYYPTPVSLAVKMWETFRDGSYLHRDRHILEPSAGTGDLVKAVPESRYGSNRPIVDVCEIDPERLEILGKTAGVRGWKGVAASRRRGQTWIRRRLTRRARWRCSTSSARR